MSKIILSIFLSLFLFACTDGGGIGGTKEYCWDCTTTMVTTATGMPSQTSTTKTEQCGLTQEQATSYEKATSSTSTASAGGITATTKATTRCIRK